MTCRSDPSVGMVIEEGIAWYWAERVMYQDPPSTMPDFADWTATFVVYPNGDATQTPVISLSTTAGITLGPFGADEQVTTLASGASSGAVTVTLTSGTGAAVGRQIVIALGDGSMHLTTMAGVAGSVITLGLPLPDAVASGAAVTHYASTHMVANVLISLDAAATSALTPWGMGLYNLDLIDPYGHPAIRFDGVAYLERGSDHV